MQNFSDRLEYLLAERKIYPWARGLGVSNGAAESMKNGTIPGSEILGLIRQKENVNLDWLLTGHGSPFIIEWCERAELLQKTLELARADQAPEEPFWLHFVTDGQRLVLIIRKPSLYHYRNRDIIYDDHRLLSVTVYPHLLRTIKDFCKNSDLFCKNSDLTCKLHRLPAEQMNHLQRGLLGPFMLLGTLLTSSEDLSSPDSLLDEIEANQPSEDLPEVSTPLMRSVIQCVESTALEEGITLNSQQRARVYTSVYRHAVRSGLSSREIDVSSIRSVLEVF